MKKRVKVNVIEIDKLIVPSDIRRARAVVKRYFPDAGQVQLYRTMDGRVVVMCHLSILPGDRKKLDNFYRDLLQVIGGNRRGRPLGEPTVQTKLNLPKSIYNALKSVSQKSGKSMSQLVAECVNNLGKL